MVSIPVPRDMCNWLTSSGMQSIAEDKNFDALDGEAAPRDTPEARTEAVFPGPGQASRALARGTPTIYETGLVYGRGAPCECPGAASAVLALSFCQRNYTSVRWMLVSPSTMKTMRSQMLVQ
jgi:hypothetical protein